MRLQLLCASFALLALASGCGEKPAMALAPATAPVQSAAPPPPDVGKIDSVRTTASGLGQSAGEAMAEAMKLALLQVNGAVIQTQGVAAKYGLDVSLNQDSASLRANAFAEVVRQRSGGVIQNLKVLSLEEPGEKTPGRYKATIEADIATFKPSADMQKIKVVVGQVRFEQATLPMGDRAVSAAEVGATLRQRISDALVQTGRFTVLDREFSPEIANEMEMIASGQAPSAELVKLSQAASADLVWSARVSRLAYNRHVRQLKTSDRELVSYSGGWAISHKLVNVATRQVMVSGSLQGQAPGTEPTTLGTGVDGGKVLGDMSGEMVNQVVASILQRTFPIMVVARDGADVILSQGGQGMKPGMRYAVVAMGNEMKDPQTGQSLGRVESPCCELTIHRVTPNLSYGRLENVRSNLDALPVGGLQVREELKSVAVAAISSQPEQSAAAQAPGAPSTGGSTTQPAKSAPVRRPAAGPAEAVPQAPPPKTDDKW